MKDISSALRSRMIAAAAALSLPVAWPLESFNPPDGDYLRFYFTAAGDNALSFGQGGLDSISGFMQVDVVCKIRAGVNGVMLSIFDTLRSQFKIGTVLTYNNTRVTIKNRDYTDPQSVDGWAVAHLTFYWSSYETRS
ncbi:phage tail terminator-like protein [Sodalis sp. RH22]|uniref:phage tail terminator-like protein n=1 Tax=unclassified Sodalis (in: enterobacteria) TaxID=2636512 RepID=UPI0039B3A7D6